MRYLMMTLALLLTSHPAAADKWAADVLRRAGADHVSQSIRAEKTRRQTADAIRAHHRIHCAGVCRGVRPVHRPTLLRATRVLSWVEMQEYLEGRRKDG
jgi:hypothetical protein